MIAVSEAIAPLFVQGGIIHSTGVERISVTPLLWLPTVTLYDGPSFLVDDMVRQINRIDPRVKLYFHQLL